MRTIRGVVLKLADAEIEPESVMVTVCPPNVEAGTVNVAPVKEPTEFVLVVPLSVIDTPPKVAVIV